METGFLQCSWIPAFAGMTGKGISRRQRHRIETRKPGDGRRRGNRARRHSAHGLRHRMDMFGRGAAAAADHVDQPFLGPLTDEARRCVRLFVILAKVVRQPRIGRSEEHTSELQSLMRISYAVFCWKKKNNKNTNST